MTAETLGFVVTSSGLLTAERVERVQRLMAEAKRILQTAISEHITDDGKTVAGIVAMFSGGNDSTTLTHLFLDQINAAGHANTGIGIERTRDFVRDCCATWDLKLLEKHPPAGSTYDELVIDQGFPGPGMHWKMYQRLKERCFRQIRADFVTNAHKERVVFLAGRRRAESDRRADIPESEREGSTVWVSPLVNWTKLDLNTYRAMHQLPRNPVSDLLHMSGECLCGAFAHPGEYDEVVSHFPEFGERIAELQVKVEQAGHDAKRCRWGWGSDFPDEPRSRTGIACGGCEGQLNMFEDAA